MPITEETRILIFNKLKKNLEKFTPPMVAIVDSSTGSYEIIGNKPVPYGYSKKIVPFPNLHEHETERGCSVTL